MVSAADTTPRRDREGMTIGDSETHGCENASEGVSIGFARRTGSTYMTKSTLEAEAILKRAAPLTHQQAHGIQPFGHLVRMPIALSEQTCKESVENLNQLLADTISARSC